MLYTFPIKNVGDVKIYCAPEFFDTVNELLNYCCENSDFCALLRSILSSYSDFSIAFVDKELPADGQWHTGEHQIQIKEHLAFDDLLHTLVFECCNAQNPKLKNFNLKNFSNAEEYATFAEEAEYDSYKCHHDITLKGIQTGVWLLSPNQTIREAQTLNDWMEDAKNETNTYGAKSHFNLYVNFFNQQKLKNNHESENTVKVTNTVRQQL